MTLVSLRKTLKPWLRKVGEVVLSALPARLLMDDTQAYICMDCKGVSATVVGGNGLWQQNKIGSPHLEVAFRPCVSGDLHKKGLRNN